MEHLCMICPRFNNQLTEAISKNFIAVAQELGKYYKVNTYTPTDYGAQINGQKKFWANKQSYSNLLCILSNYHKISKLLREEHYKYSTINLYIGIPFEMFIFRLFSNRKIREKCIVTIWQSYLTPKELFSNFGYFSRKWANYIHHFLLNNKIIATASIWGHSSYKKIVVQTDYQRNHLDQIGLKKNVAVIPNGLTPPPNNTRRKGFFSEDEKMFICLGHTTEVKGFDVALELFAAINSRVKSQLTIASSHFGNDKKVGKMISSLGIAEHVTWKGHVDVYLDLEQAHALLIPYHANVGTSLIPNVILESFAVGTPVITTNMAMLDGITEDSINAIVIDPNNIQDSALKVLRIISSPSTMNKISVAQRDAFKNNYQISQMIRRYKNLISPDAYKAN